MADEMAPQAVDYDTALAAFVQEMVAAGATPSEAVAAADEIVSQPQPPSRMPRQIQRRAMAGREPTPEQADYLQSVLPQKEARGEALGRIGLELTGVPQMGRAASGIGEAINDPSLANVTNAGAQTALAALRPGMALKVLGGGYAGALASDLGAFGTPATAQATKKTASLPGLAPEQQAAYDAAQKKLQSGFANGADRRQTEALLGELRAVSNEFVRSQNAGRQGVETQAATSRQQEYDRAVSKAEMARDHELARDRRFSDTEVGKIWDKTGGLAPLAAGALTGAMSRTATGGGNPLLYNYALPAGLGTMAGASAANVPLAYNALFTEPDNPQKRAYEAYARELPPAHPRRGEFEAYAQGLPEANPVRTSAAKEFYDPVKLAERLGMGGAEGFLGGMIGGDIPRAMGRAATATGDAVGRMRNALDRPPQAQAPTPQLPYGTPLEAGTPSLRPTSGPATAAGTLPGAAMEPNRLALPAMPPAGQGRSLAPEASASRPVQSSDLPSWASPAPAEIRLPKGQYWDAALNRPRLKDGTFGDMPKYSTPKTKNQ